MNVRSVQANQSSSRLICLITIRDHNRISCVKCKEKQVIFHVVCELIMNARCLTSTTHTKKKEKIKRTRRLTSKAMYIVYLLATRYTYTRVNFFDTVHIYFVAVIFTFQAQKTQSTNR